MSRKRVESRSAGPFRMSLVTTQLLRLDGAWRVAEQAIATEFEFAP